MTQDPGFLFYPGDYLRDTQCLSENVQVAYDRIMCEHMRNICISQQQLNFFTKKLSETEKNELLAVLKKTDVGFQIAWVAISICKYNAYRQSRSKNRVGKTKKDINDISTTHDNHMDIDIESNTVLNNKGVDASVWPPMPGPEQIDLDLPEIKAGCALEFMTLMGNPPKPADVKKLWKIFKTQNFTGSKFYATPDEAYSHFINWSKTQKVNGTHQRSNQQTKIVPGIVTVPGSRKF